MSKPNIEEARAAGAEAARNRMGQPEGYPAGRDCSNCRFWMNLGQEGFPQYGECHAIHADSSLRSLEQGATAAIVNGVTAQYDDDTALVTRPQFYCNLWEAKDGQGSPHEE